VNRTTVSLLVAGVAGLMIATSAPAAPSEMHATARVRFSDLNLHTDAGVDALYARLRKAASEVCGSPDIRELKAYAAESLCFERTLSNAVAQVHSTKLSARHELGASAARFAAL
jgi:UrcA family protein